jgi:hypothetical protein
MLVASQLRTVLAEFAGFAWVVGGADELDSDVTGYRVLAGGVDGDSVTAPQATPGLTWALVARRAAQAAARQLADADLADRATPRVLTGVTAATTPDDAAFRDQLAALHWRLLAVRASDADLDGLAELWSAVLAESGSPTEAWASVLTVLLRDPAFLTY